VLNWFSEASPFELFALVTGLGAVILLIRQNIWTWPVGLLYATVSVWVFYRDGLYGQLLLHVFFVGMNLYGWWYWTRGGQQEGASVAVIRLNLQGVLLALGCGLLGTLLLGYLINAVADSAFAWPDAAITAGSFVAMYLQARKYLESWVFWFVLDIGSIALYLAAGLSFYALLYLVYLALAGVGYAEWRKSINSSISSNLHSSL